MSYQVLARKYRPRFFNEMVGQQHVLQALINALETGRLHHAYLFSGTRGVGKTSIARILAKCLSCEQSITATPCGECTSCTEISGGHFVDLIEVDAASRTRVEDTRELLDNVQYAPTKGRFKIYLIDEVHMLSTHSFNALLKTLEEPPSHVKFLLATTDPQKLPATILSRCLQFTLKNLSAEFITGHLKHLLTTESISFEEQALWSLGHAADGSMRDALSLTDQAIAFCQGQITLDAVNQMLGTIDPQVVRHLMDALIGHDGAKILSVIKEVAEFSPNYGQMLDEVLFTLHRLTIAQQVPEAIDNQYGDQEFILAKAQRLSPEELQLFYQMALLGKKDFALAPSPRSGFEMTMLRLLSFRPLGVSEPERLDQNLTQTDSQPDAKPLQSTKDQTDGMPEAMNRPSADVHSANDEPDSHAPENNTQATELKKKPINEISTQTSEQRALNSPEPLVLANTDVIEKEISPDIVAQLEESLEVLLPDVTEPQDSPETQSFEGKVQPANDESVDAQPTPIISIKSEAENTSQVVSSPVADDIEQQGEAANQQWLDCYEALSFQGLLGSIAAHMVVESCLGEKWQGKITSEQSQLLNSNHTKQIEQALSAHLSIPIKLTLNVGEHNLLTPDQRKQQIKAAEAESALSFLKENQPLQSILDDYDAQIDNKTVELIRR